MANDAAVKIFRELQALDVKNVKNYLRKLFEVLAETKITFRRFIADTRILSETELGEAINIVIYWLLTNQENGKSIIIIGNGGSAGIAIHSLADYANVGGFKTIDLFNPALLTCMSNDYGYKNVFSQPIEMFAKSGDVLFAISSSGKSENIIKAAKTALSLGCTVITFSAFDTDNSLRQTGDLNFYSPSQHYGFVELAHQIIIHCILDLFVRSKVYEEMKQAIG